MRLFNNWPLVFSVQFKDLFLTFSHDAIYERRPFVECGSLPFVLPFGGISRYIWSDFVECGSLPFVLPFGLSLPLTSPIQISVRSPTVWLSSCYCLGKFSGSSRLWSSLQRNEEQNEWKMKRGNKKNAIFTEITHRRLCLIQNFGVLITWDA